LLLAGGGWWLSRPKPVAVVLKEIERGLVESTIANTRAGTVEACQRTRLSTISGGDAAKADVAQAETALRDFLRSSQNEAVVTGSNSLDLFSLQSLKPEVCEFLADGRRWQPWRESYSWSVCALSNVSPRCPSSRNAHVSKPSASLMARVWVDPACFSRSQYLYRVEASSVRMIRKLVSSKTAAVVGRYPANFPAIPSHSAHRPKRLFHG
jgi:hypothetical protein